LKTQNKSRIVSKIGELKKCQISIIFKRAVHTAGSKGISRSIV